MPSLLHKDLAQRHTNICTSLTKLYNLVKARTTAEQQEITFSYIEGWLKTDLTYLQQLLSPQFFSNKH